MIKGLSIRRTVNFVAPNGEWRPAIIVRVNNAETGNCALHVFTMPGEIWDDHSITSGLLPDVPYEPKPKLFSWHFGEPPKELELKPLSIAQMVKNIQPVIDVSQQPVRMVLEQEGQEPVTLRPKLTELGAYISRMRRTLLFQAEVLNACVKRLDLVGTDEGLELTRIAGAMIEAAKAPGEWI